MNVNTDDYALQLFLDPKSILEQMKKDKGEPLKIQVSEMDSEDFKIQG